MLIEHISNNWPLLIISVITVALVIYALVNRQKAKNTQIYIAGIIMLVLGLVGLYFGIYHGIMNPQFLVPEDNRVLPDMVTTYGSEAIFLGALLTLGSIAFIIFGLLILRMSKQEKRSD